MSHSTPLPETLIRANMALYKGERGEVLRLLAVYENERGNSENAHLGLCLWLYAQAQTDDDERRRLLLALIAEAPATDAYVQLAQDALQAEAPYIPTQRRQRMGARGWFSLVIGAGVILVAGLFLQGAPSPQDVPPTPTALSALVASATPPPDRSQPLVADSFTLRYDEGILSVLALEDRSERVIDGGGRAVQPITGARFYALNLGFECRSGVCSQPPQARLQLRTDNNDLLNVRADVLIAGQPTLQPIALGRITQGWVIFEVPALSRVQQLEVLPASYEADAEPLRLNLP